MPRDDPHQRRLSDDAAQRPEKTKAALQQCGANQKTDEGHGQVSQRQPGHHRNVKRHSDFLRQLAGNQSAADRADGPHRLDESEAARARMQDVVGQATTTMLELTMLAIKIAWVTPSASTTGCCRK